MAFYPGEDISKRYAKNHTSFRPVGFVVFCSKIDFSFFLETLHQ